MRVAIDARTVFDGPRRGTGKNLVDLYRRVAELRPDWRFLLFHQRPRVDDPFSNLPNIESIHVDIRGDRLNLWEQMRLPLACRGHRADVLHCPANTAPRWPLVPLLVTIHDLIPLELHGGSPASIAWAKRVRRAARSACCVVTPSEYSKQQIVERLGTSPEKVIVNYWAPDGRCRRVQDATELDRVRRKYGVRDGHKYVFGFAADDARKNTVRLLKAWSQLPASLQEAHTLVLVGLQSHALERFRGLAQLLMPGGNWVLHGFADESDLSALMSGAALLCYPSLSEGFGLPVIDGFLCETPVLTSSSTSLPEVAGDAALLVEPTCVASIRDGLERLLSNSGLRCELVERGRQRLAAFTWDQCAAKAVQILERSARKGL